MACWDVGVRRGVGLRGGGWLGRGCVRCGHQQRSHGHHGQGLLECRLVHDISFFERGHARRRGRTGRARMRSPDSSVTHPHAVYRKESIRGVATIAPHVSH